MIVQVNEDTDIVMIEMVRGVVSLAHERNGEVMTYDTDDLIYDQTYQHVIIHV